MTNKAYSNVSDIIVDLVNDAEDGLGIAEIHQALKRSLRGKAPTHRTVRRKLAELVEEGTLVRVGKARAVKYRRPARTPAPVAVDEARLVIPISSEGKAVQEYVRRPLQGRKPAGYEHEFLRDYLPNHTYYLPETIRQDLYLMGEIRESAPVGSTYQPETVNRLLVDLSWASSRLEGNTYSQIDTQYLVVDGVFAEGKDQSEADMILNHKHAIEMLLENAESLDYNMYTFLSLHKLLSDNLMGDPGAVSYTHLTLPTKRIV